MKALYQGGKGGSTHAQIQQLGMPGGGGMFGGHMGMGMGMGMGHMGFMNPILLHQHQLMMLQQSMALQQQPGLAAAQQKMFLQQQALMNMGMMQQAGMAHHQAMMGAAAKGHKGSAPSRGKPVQGESWANTAWVGGQEKGRRGKKGSGLPDRCMRCVVFYVA